MNYKLKYFLQLLLSLLVLALVLLMTSCSADDDDTYGGAVNGMPIAFSATPAAPADGWSSGTRAAGDVTLTTLKDGTGFGVFAAYTGLNRYTDSSVSPDFMYNQQVQWDDADLMWSYEPVKYWPGGEGEDGEVPHYVSFFAYGPYSDLDDSSPDTNPAGYCISGFSNAHAQGDPWLTYRLIGQDHLDKQVDLVYARSLDETRSESAASPVELVFYHPLACIGDNITIAAGTEMQTAVNAYYDGTTITSVALRLTTVSISYTLTGKGRLSLWDDGTPYWQPVLSGTPTQTITPTLTQTLPAVIYSYDGTATADEWCDTGNGVFCLPIEVGGNVQQAVVKVAYQFVVNGSEVVNEREVTKTIALTDLIETGKRLSLKITLIPPE